MYKLQWTIYHQANLKRQQVISWFLAKYVWDWPWKCSSASVNCKTSVMLHVCFFPLFYFSRCMLILNGRLIIELLWKFPKVLLVAGHCTPWPETNWSCLLCCALRPATMSPLSNMGPTAMTGSSSTAWLTEKVSGLLWMSCYCMYQPCWCFFLAQLCILFRGKRWLQHPRGSCLPWSWHIPDNVCSGAGLSGAPKHGGCGQTSLLWRLHVLVSEYQHVSLSLMGTFITLENPLTPYCAVSRGKIT